MRGGVIRDLVSGRANRFQFRRESRRAFADDKKGRFRFEAPQHFEHARRVDRVRSVVDREPDFAPGRFEMRHDRAPPLAVRDQRREENQQVGKEENAEREQRMKGDDGEKKERRAKAKPRINRRLSLGFIEQFLEENREKIEGQEPEPENA